MEKANSDNEDVWEIEYRATEAFNLQSIDVSQMEGLFKRIRDADLSRETSEDYFLVQNFSLYNSVSYNKDKCGEECRRRHACAIGELEHVGYEACVSDGGQSINQNRQWLLLTLFGYFVTKWNF